MSIFKTREWWTCASSHVAAASTSGLQNEKCLVIDKVGTNYDSDLILNANGNGYFKIFKPQGEFKPTDLILEQNFGETIVQIETGKFLANSDYIQILLLFGRKFAVFDLTSKEGNTDIGVQNVLHLAVEHNFKSESFSLVAGRFGKVKTRDLICIHMFDCSFNIYDQDVFLFSFCIQDVTLPIPFAYIASSDCFVISKTSWIIEIYSYQQLTEIPTINIKQSSKQLIPQWVYNTGEEICSIQVVQTSSNISSIIVLGERHLYCLQDNGLLKFIRRLDYTPVCFWAYLIGWYYEPGARLLIMVASDERKLMIYENTKLIWSCELPYTPISISKAVIPGLPGGIITLSPEGVITCLYLGTEPDLNSRPLLQGNENVDHVKVQQDLEEVEGILRRINDGEDSETEDNSDDLINITIKMETKHLTDESLENDPKYPLDISIKADKTIKSIQLCYSATKPLTLTETTQFVENSTMEIIHIKNYVYICTDLPISSLSVKISFILIDDNEKVRVITKNVNVSLSFVYKEIECIKGGSEKIVLICQEPSPASLEKIFPEFDCSKIQSQSSAQAMSFVCYNDKNNDNYVSVELSKNLYCIYSNNYSNMAILFSYLIGKLGLLEIRLEYVGGISPELMRCLFDCIDLHAEERLELQGFEDELSILQKQFVLIQKRLLVQFGAVPPGNCDRLQFLMKDTHKRIVDCVDKIIEKRITVFRAGCNLSSITSLLIEIMKLLNVNEEYVQLFEAVISADFLNEDYQAWEEVVSQSVSFVLRTTFCKTEKDKEKLVALTDEGILHQNNLKRFFKMLRLFIDQILRNTPVCVQEADKREAATTRIMEIEEKI